MHNVIIIMSVYRVTINNNNNISDHVSDNYDCNYYGFFSHCESH